MYKSWAWVWDFTSYIASQNVNYKSQISCLSAICSGYLKVSIGYSVRHLLSFKKNPFWGGPKAHTCPFLLILAEATTLTLSQTQLKGLRRNLGLVHGSVYLMLRRSTLVL